MIAFAVRLFERARDVDRDVDADLIDQSQRSHWHSPFYERIIDLVRTDALFEKVGSVEQVRKQNAIDQKTGTVPHHHR